MALTRQRERRESIGKQGDGREGDIEVIKAETEEIRVRTEISPGKRASSVWRWHEEFAREWRETFITKKKRRSTKVE